MAGTARYRVDQVIAAIRASHGVLTYAAFRLRCTRQALWLYARRHPQVQAAITQARGELLDLCELKLWQAIQHDEAWAILFCLRTMGRQRGYVPWVEHKTLRECEGLAVLLTETKQGRRPRRKA